MQATSGASPPPIPPQALGSLTIRCSIHAFLGRVAVEEVLTNVHVRDPQVAVAIHLLRHVGTATAQHQDPVVGA